MKRYLPLVAIALLAALFFSSCKNGRNGPKTGSETPKQDTPATAIAKPQAIDVRAIRLAYLVNELEKFRLEFGPETPLTDRRVVNSIIFRKLTEARRDTASVYPASIRTEFVFFCVNCGDGMHGDTSGMINCCPPGPIGPTPPPPPPPPAPGIWLPRIVSTDPLVIDGYSEAMIDGFRIYSPTGGFVPGATLPIRNPRLGETYPLSLANHRPR